MYMSDFHVCFPHIDMLNSCNQYLGHRVVCSSGLLGGYHGSSAEGSCQKIALLKSEGITISETSKGAKIDSKCILDKLDDIQVDAEEISAFFDMITQEHNQRTKVVGCDDTALN
jgi:hypothetical protein